MIAPQAGTNFGFSIYARADHPGALAGVNVNGRLFMSRAVHVGGYQDYGMSVFTPDAADVIRVWLYAPAAAGFVVIDDAVLVKTSSP